MAPLASAPAPRYPGLAPSYVMLDLETTGATGTTDRITEIGLVRIEGGQEVARFSSLVNPGMPVPPFIQRLTGITTDMVAAAPPFEDLASTLAALLKDAVLVAHNVRFDHGFLKNEFARLDIDLRVKTLCTVRLSRKLYPQYKSHGLDAIMQRHGLNTLARHRAMGDVEVVLAWLKEVETELGLDTLQAATNELLAGSSSIPSHLQTPIKNIPQTPGVYVFYGESPLPLYIGKSVNLRARVMSHFQADHKINKDMRIAQELTRIEWFETAGELGALLLESRMVKQLQPVHNQQLRRQNQLCTWELVPDPSTRPLLNLRTMAQLDATAQSHLYGPFRSKKQALDGLRTLAEEHNLCLQALGLESGKGKCFAHQIGKCRGVCCGQESPALHYARVQVALSQLKLARWPFAGKIALREMSTAGDRTDVHVFDQWCHLATARDDAELEEAKNRHHGDGLAFDLDTYKMLQKFLAKPQNRSSIVLLR
jgi:DNA polymerase III subunit epsilon